MRFSLYIVDQAPRHSEVRPICPTNYIVLYQEMRPLRGEPTDDGPSLQSPITSAGHWPRLFCSKARLRCIGHNASTYICNNLKCGVVLNWDIRTHTCLDTNDDCYQAWSVKPVVVFPTPCHMLGHVSMKGITYSPVRTHALASIYIRYFHVLEQRFRPEHLVGQILTKSTKSCTHSIVKVMNAL